MAQLEPWMLDDGAAWWAKIRRADQHRAALAALIEAFLAAEPYTLLPEKTERPNEVAYRLQIHREVPADVSTTVGDVLHNLRSALDSLAFVLAQRSVARPLTSEEEQSTEFPITESPDKFEAFFGHGPHPTRAQRLRHVYSERARSALELAQPYFYATQIPYDSEEERLRRYAEEFEWSDLQALRVLHNVDKHRRLNLIAFWPDLLYFGTNEGDDVAFRWSGRFQDGEIFCYLAGEDAPTTTLEHDFALVLTDHPGHRPNDPLYTPRDCMDTLEGFSQSVRFKVHSVLTEFARLA